MANEKVTEEEAVSEAREILETHKAVSEEDYEVSGVLDYTKFGKWRVIFDVEGENGAVKIDVDERSGDLIESNNLK